MNNLDIRTKAFFNRLDELAYQFLEWNVDLTRWFLADVAYTLLPIAVIVSIKAITNNPGNYLYLSPEWSFASIVSFGAAITTFIELKTEIQQDFSHKVYSLTRLIVILLIVSVIVLCLVVLREDGLNINAKMLWQMQLTLLLVSLGFLYIAHWRKKEHRKLDTEFQSNMGRRKYYRVLAKRINRIQDDLLLVRFALSKHSEIEFSTTMTPKDIQFWECDDRNKLVQQLCQIEESVKELHNLSDIVLNSQIPELNSDVNETTNSTKEVSAAK